MIYCGNNNNTLINKPTLFIVNDLILNCHNDGCKQGKFKFIECIECYINIEYNCFQLTPEWNFSKEIKLILVDCSAVKKLVITG